MLYDDDYNDDNKEMPGEQNNGLIQKCNCLQQHLSVRQYARTGVIVARLGDN